MRFYLGRFGTHALQTLSALEEAPNAAVTSIKAREALALDIKDRINLELRIPIAAERERIVEHASVFPPGETVPDLLKEQIVKQWGEGELAFLRGVANVRVSFVVGNFSLEDLTLSGKEYLFATSSGGVVYGISDGDVRYIGDLVLKGPREIIKRITQIKGRD
jgi:hypothetical protein